MSNSSLLKIFITLFLFLITTGKALAVDVTPPTTTYTMTPSTPDGNNDWYVSVVNFNLEATDVETGVASINYRIDGGTWIQANFSDTLNQAPNPSFETTGATTTGLESWEVTTANTDANYSQSTTEFAPGYATSSIHIGSSAPAGNFRSVNHYNSFVPATPYQNMTASAWVKTTGVTEQVYFKIYSIAPDGSGGETYTQIAQSSSLSGTNDWTKLSLEYVVSNASATGVYMDIGVVGPGNVWVDAVTMNASINSPNVTFNVGSESANHTVEFYSIDNAGNIETYSCTIPIKNCVTFKIDLNPPGNWYDSGAFRGPGSADHELFIFTSLTDEISGLSSNTNRYQYKTELNPTFGRYENLIACNTAWIDDDWVDLSSTPINDGDTNGYLQTQRTDLCNSNWKLCKIAKFYAEDMAGHSTTKDFCINGPWISFLQGGLVGTNSNIDMVAEPPDFNTSGVIEIAGTSIEFFTSEFSWEVRNSPIKTFYTYQQYFDATASKTTISDSIIPSTSGLYYINGDFTIDNGALGPQYTGNKIFSQIVFFNGNLTIDTNLGVDDESAVLYIVSGDVLIDENVNTINVGIITDGALETAYNADATKPISTLEAKGIYRANDFVFQRTVQGTNNNTTPSEEYTYDPQLLIKLKPYLLNKKVQWKTVE